METAKENESSKTHLVHVNALQNEATMHTQAVIPSRNNVKERRYLTLNEVSVKTENSEHGDEVSDDLEVLPTNTSIISNVCNMTLPISSASAHIAEMIKADSFLASQLISKNRRKTKSNGLLEANNIEQPYTSSILDSNEDGLQCGESKQSEVLKAAKSLFSKRTRTLYHWMYPNASKQQLKLAITNSWETLSTEEKEFYISQVLGRFGFPQRSLMVNPQLGCINSINALSSFPVSSSLQASEETKIAVSSILVNENRNSVSRHTDIDAASYGNVKKRRLHRSQTKRSKGRRNDTRKMSQELVNTDEFQDDPELNREFQQFKWTLRMSDDDK